MTNNLLKRLAALTLALALMAGMVNALAQDTGHDADEKAALTSLLLDVTRFGADLAIAASEAQLRAAKDLIGSGILRLFSEGSSPNRPEEPADTQDEEQGFFGKVGKGIRSFGRMLNDGRQLINSRISEVLDSIKLKPDYDKPAYSVPYR